jgi:hypothetical protein
MEEDYAVFGLKLNCKKNKLVKRFKELKEQYKGDDVNTKKIYKARTNIELGRTKEIVEKEKREKEEKQEKERNNNKTTTNTHTYNGNNMSLEEIKKLPGIESLKLVPGLENIFEDNSSFFQGGTGFNEYFRKMMGNNPNGQQTFNTSSGSETFSGSGFFTGNRGGKNTNTVTNVSYVMRGGKMVKISDDTTTN